MYKATLYIISAPSGCGKTSLIQALSDSTPLAVSISYTTRLQRPNEMHGVHYQFVTLDRFHQMIQSGFFLEYAQVFNHYYGTSRSWVETQLRQGVDTVVEIDWQGMRAIKKHYPEAVSILILPPSIDSLRERLIQRAEDSIEVIATRLQQAQIEIGHYEEYDYLILNKEFQQALADLRTIIHANHLRTFMQKNIATSLLKGIHPR